MSYKRLVIGLIFGALLGIVCIIGAQIRSGYNQPSWYLFAFWFNRLLMGGVIGLIPIKTPLNKRLLRGAIVGIVISFAFYSATNYADLTGFLVGAIYGVIIEYGLFKFGE